MIKEAQSLLEVLHNKGYEAYFIGGKPRNELHNQFHDHKVDIKDIDIVTNATPEEIQKQFRGSELRGVSFQVVAVRFAGFEFEIATYRTDKYDYDKVKKSKKVQKPKTKIAKDLNTDRERRDYTINTIAEDLDGNFIDYKYKYRNKPISAIKDIENGIIRAIGNVRMRFEEDPLRIIRGFRFMSQLGYEFDDQTFKILQENIKLIEKLPHERIADEMNKLILGRYASKALILMKEIGIFKLNVVNSILDKTVQMLSGLNDLTEKDFKTLDLLNMSDQKGDVHKIEAWTLLLKPLGVEKAIETLESIYVLNKVGIEKVHWLIDNYTIINSVDIRNDLFNARVGVVKRYEIPVMKEMIQRISNIYVKLYGKEYKEKADKLMFEFCCRPYFHNQLRVTGEDLIELADEEPGPWIKITKEKLLHRLINTDKYPKDDELYTEMVKESIEEALIEETMEKEGLI